MTFEPHCTCHQHYLGHAFNDQLVCSCGVSHAKHQQVPTECRLHAALIANRYPAQMTDQTPQNGECRLGHDLDLHGRKEKRRSGRGHYMRCRECSRLRRVK